MILEPKKKHPKTKSELHPRNKHRERYNFANLIKSYPALAPFVVKNKYNDQSINFFDNKAVLALNRALLGHFYNIRFWEIPNNYLCPPIPGRADYIHYVADLLNTNNRIPIGTSIRCLDIGVGANCIYPIIGVNEYGWSFVASEVNPVSAECAKKIVDANPEISGKIDIRFQKNSDHFFAGIIAPGEKFQLSICNPPFHGSAKEAQAGTQRKLRNLKGKKTMKTTLNFGGQHSELWCNGGEKQFVVKMIEESKDFSDSCIWFTTLVSKENNLPKIYNTLRNVHALRVKTIKMGQGNKKSRIVAWSFQQ